MNQHKMTSDVILAIQAFGLPADQSVLRDTCQHNRQRKQQSWVTLRSIVMQDIVLHKQQLQWKTYYRTYVHSPHGHHGQNLHYMPTAPTSSLAFDASNKPCTWSCKA